MNLVKILIPIYKSDISELEMRSLQQACQVLHAYPIVIIKPKSLDISAFVKLFPVLTAESFDDDYFKGIPGYNRLMLSRLFYERFLDTQYILIYQLDAYVFRDELRSWCDKGYDYIGAPWLRKPIYNFPLIAGIMSLLRQYQHYKGKPSKQLLYNKVGNGGFSLRKVESHYKATETHNGEIASFQAQKRSHLYNEDVFWGTVPHFSYPSPMEALGFAFDKYPAYCFRLKHGQLPFGCHSWYKRKMKRFWQPIINF